MNRIANGLQAESQLLLPPNQSIHVTKTGGPLVLSGP
jgi:hypothetical protein